MVDKEYRRRVVAQFKNPVVKTLVSEYAKYSERLPRSDRQFKTKSVNFVVLHYPQHCRSG